MKKKINGLRTYFTKELGRTCKKSEAGREEIYESKWPQLQSLMFLRDTITPRKTISSYVCILM